MKSGKFSISSRLKSFKYGFSGIWMMLKNEHNSRIHLLAGIIAVTLGFVFHISLTEWSLLIIVIGAVFVTELFNSALEAISDYINHEWNEKIRIAKDFAAAAVLLAAIVALFVGLMIFGPCLLALF